MEKWKKQSFVIISFFSKSPPSGHCFFHYSSEKIFIPTVNISYASIGNKESKFQKQVYARSRLLFIGVLLKVKGQTITVFLLRKTHF